MTIITRMIIIILEITITISLMMKIIPLYVHLTLIQKTLENSFFDMTFSMMIISIMTIMNIINTTMSVMMIIIPPYSPLNPNTAPPGEFRAILKVTFSHEDVDLIMMMRMLMMKMVMFRAMMMIVMIIDLLRERFIEKKKEKNLQMSVLPLHLPTYSKN